MELVSDRRGRPNIFFALFYLQLALPKFCFCALWLLALPLLLRAKCETHANRFMQAAEQPGQAL
jgi:hypothetical protein